MANGEVKIHDPFSNHNGHTHGDPESPSDSLEDTVEFRLLMAYAKRRRPQTESPPQAGPLLVNGDTDTNVSSPQTPTKTEKEEKKRRRKPWKPLRKMFSCIKPQTTDEPRDEEPRDEEPRDGEPPCQRTMMRSGLNDRSGDSENEMVNDQLTEIAARLTGIADEIRFTPPELETDSVDDPNVEKMIGLLLRETGDRLNERELKDASLSTELFWNYSFFELLMNALLLKMGLTTPNPDSLGPKASPKTQIAVTCEVTSRLSAVNSLPRNRLLDHGARYLQYYYSAWAQEQGGYEGAFYSDDEDDTQ